MPTKLEQAITAIEAGDKATGKQLLIELLKTDRRNEDVWLWLTKVVDTNEERIKCLQNVLKINPQNEIAKRGLARFQSKQQIVEPGEEPPDVATDSLLEKIKALDNRSKLLIAVPMLLLFVCAGCCTWGVFGNFLFSMVRPAEQAGPGPAPVVEATGTPTPIPVVLTEETPLPLPTAGPVEPTPTSTPVVAATGTPTPRPGTATPTPIPTETPTALTPSEGPLVIIEVNDEDEYVDIQNISDAPVDLTNWRLFSERGEQDCVLGGVVLQPGEILRIWASSRDTEKGGYFCGLDEDIWNDSEPDPAILYDPSGVEVSRMD